MPAVDAADPAFHYHGTTTGYRVGCRCSKCKHARREYKREYRARIRNSVVPDHVHGTAYGYVDYGCRCDSCTRGHRDSWREWDQRRKMA